MSEGVSLLVALSAAAFLALVVWFVQGFRKLRTRPDRLRDEMGRAAETLVAAHLQRTLAQPYRVKQNLRIEEGRRHAELDVVVVGPNGLFLIEVKNWRGEWEVLSSTEWRRLQSFRVQHSPTEQASYHERVVRAVLDRHKLDVPIHSVVALANRSTVVHGRTALPCLYFKELPGYIVRQTGHLPGTAETRVWEVLAGASPSRTPKR